ncbi:putative protein tyrosine phosphatase type IVA A [Besnoitia besnoiti]|uniref:protein-tyrosine-phosphatase n=1 Tax=Besnoitia besnoiti TaxID=94643 RepID=A0A2A9M670_BESBE|nr:putative protein tyrosine phosphatase type IVA A [Besnoitia besnoiti]PFH31811.1 putative protein tyrosine phosphatase type IVA A [Besnoitia besnoiti]
MSEGFCDRIWRTLNASVPVLHLVAACGSVWAGLAERHAPPLGCGDQFAELDHLQRTPACDEDGSTKRGSCLQADALSAESRGGERRGEEEAEERSDFGKRALRDDSATAIAFAALPSPRRSGSAESQCSTRSTASGAEGFCAKENQDLSATTPSASSLSSSASLVAAPRRRAAAGSGRESGASESQKGKHPRRGTAAANCSGLTEERRSTSKSASRASTSSSSSVSGGGGSSRKGEKHSAASQRKQSSAGEPRSRSSVASGARHQSNAGSSAGGVKRASGVASGAATSSPPGAAGGSGGLSVSGTFAGRGAMAARTVMNTPTRIEAGRQRFLIFDAPSQENLAAYIKEMQAYEVTDLVRTCERTYDEKAVMAVGIRAHEMIFPDGEAPPDEVIDEWLALCNFVAQQRGAIAVHCVAGLGRAPVLVAIALIEKGMDPMDAIMFIRERRKGAINRRQLQFLKSYKRRSHYQKCCVKGCTIM